MKLVEKPLRSRPGACLATGRNDGELIDFEVDFVGIDPHVYLRREVVERAAQLCGMSSRQETEHLKDELARIQAEFDQHKERFENIAELAESLQGIESKLNQEVQ